MQNINSTQYAKTNTIIIKASETGKMLATAESCTGGLIAAALTDIPGASKAFERGFVTYSNASKIEMLGVPADTIAQFGAVSANTAQAMAEGALARSGADIAISVTGIAGPDGGSVEKPVGLVFFACAQRGATLACIERRFDAALSRSDIRSMALDYALDLLLDALGGGDARP